MSLQGGTASLKVANELGLTSGVGVPGAIDGLVISGCYRLAAEFYLKL
jgi:hypothetical protein